MFRIRFVCGVWFLILIAPAAAQETFDQKYGKMISDGAALEAIKLALTKIGKVTCESKRACEPASPEEFVHPPISVEDGRAAMVAGIKSALGEWCGINWIRSFRPMIAKSRDEKKMNYRQLQLMALIHGDFQHRQIATYSKSGQCPPTLRNQFDTFLPPLSQYPSPSRE
jgi:hypothetical protein